MHVLFSCSIKNLIFHLLQNNILTMNEIPKYFDTLLMFSRPLHLNKMYVVQTTIAWLVRVTIIGKYSTMSIWSWWNKLLYFSTNLVLHKLQKLNNLYAIGCEKCKHQHDRLGAYVIFQFNCCCCLLVAAVSYNIVQGNMHFPFSISFHLFKLQI